MDVERQLPKRKIIGKSSSEDGDPADLPRPLVHDESEDLLTLRDARAILKATLQVDLDLDTRAGGLIDPEDTTHKKRLRSLQASL